MKLKLIGSIFLILICNGIFAQQYKNWSSAQILHEMQKLPNTANVLYIAAHPDDENTRLLAYLANERKCRTAYLSLTRGDGGQNLIGAEQGVELGLIRTQELLAARSIDGAEQYFSTAFDFGFSKTSEETFNIWNKQKVIADAVWVIRKFKPDVIITRFPEDKRAGHGHHAASGIVGREAYFAAADPNMFPEQFKLGVGPWKAKRLVWNTFNFGNTNTITENQLKIDVGQYNVLLGKSYGEVAAQSRSQHKSQGFGVATNRGQQYEYFTHIAGDTAKSDILEDINISYRRFNDIIKPKDLGAQARYAYKNLDSLVTDAIQKFDYATPANNIERLLYLYKNFRKISLAVNAEYKQKLLVDIILQCAGFYAEATSPQPFVYPADSLKLNVWLNARTSNKITLKDIYFQTQNLKMNTELTMNKNFQASSTIYLPETTKLTQPYWLTESMTKGMFTVKEQQKIGQADVDYEKVAIVLEIDGELVTIERKIQYKYTDPVKGEIFQPVYIVPAVDVSVTPSLIVNSTKISNKTDVTILPNKQFSKSEFLLSGKSKCDTIYGGNFWNDSLPKSKKLITSINTWTFQNHPCMSEVVYSFQNTAASVNTDKHVNVINYDHIPTIAYTSPARLQVLKTNLITNEKKIGYIEGAGDKVADALLQMGYTVDFLTKKDVVLQNIKKYDAIVTGVRTYNTNDWMNDVYNDLMEFIKQGGNLIVQYNTSNNIGPIKAKIAPYSFTISRNRVTNEDAQVTVLNTADPILNYPNNINTADFMGWVQERTVYEATDVDSNYRKIFAMNDEGEKEQNGGLIIAPHGIGNFIYCSLALFRQLPAGVEGAYKLMANLVEAKQNKINNGSTKK